MKRVSGRELVGIRQFFEAAAEVARKSTCDNSHCGTVIVQADEIIGTGYNGPAFDDEANRLCGKLYDVSKKPKYDKTCCTHAEWRAILDACKRNAGSINGAVLYFMRVDDNGDFTDAGDPYCTTCSRLTVESGIGEFALWNRNGADIYSAMDYNRKSYDYFAV